MSREVARIDRSSLCGPIEMEEAKKLELLTKILKASPAESQPADDNVSNLDLTELVDFVK